MMRSECPSETMIVRLIQTGLRPSVVGTHF